MTPQKDILEYTEDTFHHIEHHDGLAVVRFYAPWCSPCQVSESFFIDAINRTGTNLQAGKVNVLHAPVLSARYSVWGLPNVIIFYRGQPVKKLSGPMAASQYLDEFEAVLQETSRSESHKDG